VETKKTSITFNPNIPTVHSLSGNLLISAGFKKEGTTYKKGKKIVTYDGVHWFCNGERIQFIEQLNIKK
jgi:hypothetical protein